MKQPLSKSFSCLLLFCSFLVLLLTLAKGQEKKEELTTQWFGLPSSGVAETNAFYAPQGYTIKLQYRTDIEIGFRSDGIVVWRKKQ